MLGLRVAIGVAHLLDVAVVGGDDQRPAGGDRRVDDPPEAGIDDLGRGDRGVPHAGVADHVGVRVVGDDEVVARLSRWRRRARSVIGAGAHLRREVVGRHLAFDGTRMRSSPGKGGSTPPLKKYVTWAYFSVSATWSWRLPSREKVRRQRVDDQRPERDGDRQLLGRLVLGERDHQEVARPRAAVERVEVAARQRLGQLPRPVGTEVECTATSSFAMPA